MALNAWATPSGQVSYAVAASWAIPFLMSPQLLANLSEGDGTARGRDIIGRWKVVVDGGLWANFPMQCFVDESLRYYYGVPRLGNVPVVGFILDPGVDSPTVSPLRRLKNAFRNLLLDLVAGPPALLILPGMAILAAAPFGESNF